MALTKVQENTVIRLFIMVFVNCESKEARKQEYFKFENEFGKSIADWKLKCKVALIEAKAGEQAEHDFDELVTGEAYSSVDHVCTIRGLKESDLEQVREIINQGLDLHLYDNKQHEKFIHTGWSLVACNGDEILGVILADSITKMYIDEIWIDVFVVAEGVRGQGIGKRLMRHLCSMAAADRKNVISLNTQRNRDAYHIYKHWGFKEKDGVQLECLVI